MSPTLPFKLKNPDLLRQDAYIHGKAVTAKSGKRFDVIDPGSDREWASCPDMAPEDVAAAIESAHQAFQSFSTMSSRTRSKLLIKWHELIVEAKEDIATILTYETGKPIAEAYGELDYSLGFLWWFAGEAERIQGSVFTPSAVDRRTFVIKQPIGVSVALVPWNFPIAMILRKVGAAFAAGCPMVVKPSPETPLTCLTLAHLATQAGFPPGVLNVLTTSLDNTPSVSEAMMIHPRVKKVTFTGSTRVGKIVATTCAKHLKKCTLELGGNCPFIVFDDANLKQALAQFMALKWRHAGQACISANRLYVQAGVYERFTQMLVDETAKISVGHGAKKGSTMGPVTTPRGLAKAEAQAADAIKHGAQLVLGTGKALKNSIEVEGSDQGQGVGGYFMEPTILKDMNGEMLMASEETFAPVCGIFKFETEQEVVRLANDTSLGLASYVFTKNVDRVWRMFEKLEAGMIGLNTGNSSAAESPFGGIKESGMGKESGKDVAVNEYLITKTGTLTLDG
ncbi:succinate-semialdehyde dehydrogenase [Cladophialophora yegresii CBS 114405]|uniref:Succinate-semialdehyde dehydrogenase n=1 Tax=Cladophialophora yegresii CBS 114405 TaxID=1182544 RepID=W9WLI5_9EURO|nr:succinate-semialdehyde dehydrogenase [Cladophialophora yegresii CBS 114405]EXJ65471.1 succinate-semialdehyde dehydrogenase [Cladophialophora yegresii CBS 114405]